MEMTARRALTVDIFATDPTKRKLLDWRKRLHIIEGICRGLIYLHRDSRLRIIHRDLKASNILLDEDLNPKISDFGMARIFKHGQDQDETRRVVGTYGYMSPEYAMEGHFSEKSDVYSFGVLLLEIVSGKRNSSFWLEVESLTLLGYVWKLWVEGEVVSMIDPIISDPSNTEEIIRAIQVGLLCVQESVKERPSTSTVISMLSSDIANLPKPKQPGFNRRQIFEEDGSSSQHQSSGGNNVSVTTLTAR
ncbi:G-type lectin S-receptor-like serine/threonine-protein kinase SD1-13 [Silene latifolia]|uniref:G-type lectin S-receptor-like serine/threonine-protein kinase SD1-13 n=1 Tax=Silene latifolia TaxID=37657 RepID=UPI003D771BBB